MVRRKARARHNVAAAARTRPAPRSRGAMADGAELKAMMEDGVPGLLAAAVAALRRIAAARGGGRRGPRPAAASHAPGQARLDGADRRREPARPRAPRRLREPWRAQRARSRGGVPLGGCSGATATGRRGRSRKGWSCTARSAPTSTAGARAQSRARRGDPGLGRRAKGLPAARAAR